MSCTAAVDSYAATISSGRRNWLSTISERGPELTINVLKQWKKKTTRVLLE
jgi:hypothetical protein